jgi:hypothetical protein
MRLCGVFRFAGVVVKIKFYHKEFLRFAEQYRFEGKAEMTVSIHRKDIRLEKERGEKGDFPDWYYETLAIERKFSEKALSFGVLLFHSSAIAVDGQGYLFSAPSGTGKSTHARLWREMLKDRAVMINDDKPFVRVIDGKPYVYGSPWNGKHRLDSNLSAPIAGVCFLSQAAENAIRPLSAKEAFSFLSKQIFYPTQKKAWERTVLAVKQLSNALPYYHLQCNISEEAAELSYRTMSEQITRNEK